MVLTIGFLGGSRGLLVGRTLTVEYTVVCDGIYIWTNLLVTMVTLDFFLDSS